MSVVFRMLFWVAAFLAASPSPGAAEYKGVNYHWSDNVTEDPSSWANYFRQNAQILLGPERRLANGASWRLQTDRVTGIAYPRLTWMPDRNHLLAANRLLERAHGGELLVERRLQEIQENVKHIYIALNGEAPPPHPMLEQGSVDLTYAGNRFMSLQASAIEYSGGSHPTTYLRGLTFDLRAEAIVELKPCPGRAADIYAGPFRYGDLLDLCDGTHYRDFINLVRRIDLKSGRRRVGKSPYNPLESCVDWPDRPIFREDQEYVLYLTFSGLAIQAAGGDCPVKPTPDNPVIVPYRDLIPFMKPGPWRDELLSLPSHHPK